MSIKYFSFHLQELGNIIFGCLEKLAVCDLGILHLRLLLCLLGLALLGYCGSLYKAIYAYTWVCHLSPLFGQSNSASSYAR